MICSQGACALRAQFTEHLASQATPADPAAVERAAKNAATRVEVEAAALRKRREMMHEFLYTIPLTPVAGQSVDVYYNPDLTVLRGRPDIYMRGSWNRWNHSECLVPTHLEPAMRGNIGFLKTTVQVRWCNQQRFSLSKASKLLSF